MKILIVGTGYVGLVTGVCLAHHGHEVTCVDVDERRIDRLNAGVTPFYEPGLTDMLRQNMARMRFHSPDYLCGTAHAARQAEVIFLCVGTPEGSDGRPVMDAFWQAVDWVYGFVGEQSRATLAVKSTVPVGTQEKLSEYFRRRPHMFAFASVPEFLKEGDAIRDFMRPDRVVIGTHDNADRLVQLFRPFVRTPEQILVTDPASAELTKYAANAMLATRISFMNELSRLAESVGADIDAVRRGIGSDSRIGSAFLYAGLGFGGSCFPKDVKALAQLGIDHGCRLTLCEDALDANEEQGDWFLTKLCAELDRQGGQTIAIWGAAFKPETDDVRASPGLFAASELAAEGYIIRLHDPVALDNAREVLGDGVEYFASAYEAADGADALMLATEWPQLRRPDFTHLAKLMSGSIYADGRNVWPRDEIEAAGGTYLGVGRR